MSASDGEPSYTRDPARISGTRGAEGTRAEPTARISGIAGAEATATSFAKPVAKPVAEPVVEPVVKRMPVW